LNAEVKVTNSSGFKKESLVLKSVQANNFGMTELLLRKGAPVDQDSSYGRINAVMVACQMKDIKMLKLLIEHGADLNKPSHIERKDKSGKKYNVLLHPIFVASTASPELLEVSREIITFQRLLLLICIIVPSL
jgi:ankyrin repeat protein